MNTDDQYTTMKLVGTALNLPSKAWTTAPGVVGYNERLALAVGAASRWCDSYCGRRFWVDSSDSTRLFEAGSGLVTFDQDLTAFAQVSVSESDDGVSWTPVSSFRLRPYNAVPHTSVQIPGYPSWIRVRGRWGWPSDLPDEVAQAALLTAARYYQRGDTPMFASGSNEYALPVAPRDADVEALLAPYRRFSFA